MSELEIRPATPADLRGVLSLYRQLNPDDPVLDPAAVQSVWEALLTSANAASSRSEWPGPTTIWT